MKILDFGAVGIGALAVVWAVFGGDISGRSVIAQPQVSASFDYDAANAAYENGDYDTTLRLVSRPAENGDPVAQNFLGVLHNHGHGVEEDDVEAVRLFRLSAEQGFAKGQDALGTMLMAGAGTDRDLDEARYWLERSAAQGLPDGQYKLGFLLVRHPRDNDDLARGISMLRTASDAGSTSAMTELAGCYRMGLGVTPDPASAMLLLSKAAYLGSAEAMYMTGNMFYFGEGGIPQKVQAANWFEHAANEGHLEAKRRFGRMLAHGDGIQKDFERGATLVLEAAEAGYAAAQFDFGQMFYFSGQMDQAFLWISRAADQGYAPGLNTLAEMYKDGSGMAPDPRKAAELYRLSAEQDNPTGLLAYGEMLLAGTGVDENIEEGLDYLIRASEHNHGQAQFLLARLYHGSGDWVEMDYERAYFWYRIAETGEYLNYANMGDFSETQADKLAENELSAEQLARQDARIAEWRSRLAAYNNRI